MLDHVGLLSAGNEEMIRFAWKGFAQWQQREENTAEEKKKKKEMLDFLQAFRETFSRPVRRFVFSESIPLLLVQILGLETCPGNDLLPEHVPGPQILPQVGNTDY